MNVLEALAGLAGGYGLYRQGRRERKIEDRQRDLQEEDRDYQAQVQEFRPKEMEAEALARQYPEKAHEIMSGLAAMAPKRRTWDEIRSGRKQQAEIARNAGMGGTTMTAQAASPVGPLGYQEGAAASPLAQATAGRMSSEPEAVPQQQPFGVDLTGAKTARELGLEDEARVRSERQRQDQMNFLQGLLPNFPKGREAIGGAMDATMAGKPILTPSVDPGAIAGSIADGGLGAGVTGLSVLQGLGGLGKQLGPSLGEIREENDLKQDANRAAAQLERLAISNGIKYDLGKLKAATDLFKSERAGGADYYDALQVAANALGTQAPDAPPKPNPLAGLIPPGAMLPEMTDAPTGPRNTGVLPGVQAKIDNTDSLIGRRTAQTDADKARIAQAERRINLAVTKESNLAKYRNARLAEDKRFHNLLNGYRNRMATVAERRAATGELAQAWDQEYDSTKALLDEAALNGRLDNQAAGRYNSRLNSIDTTIRTLLRDPNLTPDKVQQIQGLANERKTVEDQMFGVMGAPTVRDPATGALKGFQQKSAPITQGKKTGKDTWSAEELRIIKDLQSKGNSFEAAANRIRRLPNEARAALNEQERLRFEQSQKGQ